MGKKKKESLKDLVLNNEKKDRLVYTDLEGFTSVDLDALIDSQPLTGLLYDLNRLPETVMAFVDHPEYGIKWVNDYAVYLVIKRLHERNTAKDARIEGLIQNIRDMKYWAESGYPTQTIKIADEALQQTDKE